jgi:hypothetical protein
MNAKKYANTRIKLGKLNDKNWMNDKENRFSIESSKFDKFSVDLHKLSTENHMFNKKNILN